MQTPMSAKGEGHGKHKPVQKPISPSGLRMIPQRGIATPVGPVAHPKFKYACVIRRGVRFEFFKEGIRP